MPVQLRLTQKEFNALSKKMKEDFKPLNESKRIYYQEIFFNIIKQFDERITALEGKL